LIQNKTKGDIFMNVAWWEGFTSFMCKLWWIALLVLALILTAYFTRDYWLPLLGLQNLGV